MKPDWKDAPEWAQWLAMDKDREWYWYEEKPALRSFCWRCQSGREAVAKVTGWTNSLTERPEN